MWEFTSLSQFVTVQHIFLIPVVCHSVVNCVFTGTIFMALSTFSPGCSAPNGNPNFLHGLILRGCFFVPWPLWTDPLTPYLFCICPPPALSPDSGLSACPLQGVGVADQLVQHVDDLSKLWPVSPLSLPTVQHELVERHGTVHGRGQPIALINSLDHLDSTSMLL